MCRKPASVFARLEFPLSCEEISYIRFATTSNRGARELRVRRVADDESIVRNCSKDALLSHSRLLSLYLPASLSLSRELSPFFFFIHFSSSRPEISLCVSYCTSRAFSLRCAFIKETRIAGNGNLSISRVGIIYDIIWLLLISTMVIFFFSFWCRL